jgi:hypothetical protein
MPYYPHRFKLPAGTVTDARRLCESLISPRAFWLNTGVGGKGWQISFNGARGNILEVEDPEMLTFLVLQVGSE